MHIHFSPSDQQSSAKLNGSAPTPTRAEPKALAPEGEAVESSSGRGFTTVDEAQISAEGRKAADQGPGPGGEPADELVRNPERPATPAGEAGSTDAAASNVNPSAEKRGAEAIQEFRRLQREQAVSRKEAEQERLAALESQREERAEASAPVVPREGQTELTEGRNPAETLEIARKVFREALAPGRHGPPNVDLAQKASSQIREGIRENSAPKSERPVRPGETQAPPERLA